MDMYVPATLLCMNMYVWTLMLWTCMNMYVWTLMCVSRHWLLAASQQSWSGTNFYIYFCWLWLLLFLVFTTAEELALHELATNQTQQDYDLAVGNMPPCEMWHRSTLAGLSALQQGEWDTRSNLLSWQWWVTGSARTGTGTGTSAKCEMS